MNKTILMGRLTREPAVTYTQGENPLCIARYTLAVDRKGAKNANGNEQTADFISCVAFGKQGEFAEKYLHKGMKIAVEGHIQTGSYTNKDGQRVYTTDGQKIFTTDVVIEQHEFCESKGATADGGNAAAGNAPATDDGGFINIPDGIEDLPFDNL